MQERPFDQSHHVSCRLDVDAGAMLFVRPREMTVASFAPLPACLLPALTDGGIMRPAKAGAIEAEAATGLPLGICCLAGVSYLTCT
jgi:hypothetical protein